MVLTSSADFLAGGCDSDDDTLSPALVACFQRRPHHAHVTRAVEGVVTATVRHLNQVFLYALTAKLGRIDEVGCAKLFTPRLLGIIDIHDYDFSRAILHSTLDD